MGEWPPTWKWQSHRHQKRLSLSGSMDLWFAPRPESSKKQGRCAREDATSTWHAGCGGGTEASPGTPTCATGGTCHVSHVSRLGSTEMLQAWLLYANDPFGR
eukprot:symbB.v1.2.021267.t1/scaffold1827.1/size99647/2